MDAATACELLAISKGQALRGSERCFYCGASCDQSHCAAEWVKDSFTSRDTVFGGRFVCVGCTLALDESATITLLDGTVRAEQKKRCYSWVITTDKALAATKAHRDLLMRRCLAPPEPPYAIVLSDSGQKHLLYRGCVGQSEARAVVSLEGERIDYEPRELAERIELCKKLIAGSGKPALAEPLSANTAMRIIAHHRDDSLVDSWSIVCESPLSRLALWLAPGKEECLREYPAIG